MIISQTRLKCNFFVADAHSDNNTISIKENQLKSEPFWYIIVCTKRMEKV